MVIVRRKTRSCIHSLAGLSNASIYHCTIARSCQAGWGLYFSLEMKETEELVEAISNVHVAVGIAEIEENAEEVADAVELGDISRDLLVEGLRDAAGDMAAEGIAEMVDGGEQLGEAEAFADVAATMEA